MAPLVFIDTNTPLQTPAFGPATPSDKFALATPSIVVSRRGEVGPGPHEFAHASLAPAAYVVTARLSLNPRSIPQATQIGVRLTIDPYAMDDNSGVWLEQGSREIIHLTFIAGANVTQSTFARLMLDPLPPDYFLSYRAVIAAVVVPQLVVT